MGKPNLRTKQLSHARNSWFFHPWRENNSLNPLLFVFSILVEGLSYKSTEILFAWNNIASSSQTTYYRYLHTLENAICTMAQQNCEKYWNLTSVKSHTYTFTT